MRKGARRVRRDAAVKRRDGADRFGDRPSSVSLEAGSARPLTDETTASGRGSGRAAFRGEAPAAELPYGPVEVLFVVLLVVALAPVAYMTKRVLAEPASGEDAA